MKDENIEWSLYWAQDRLHSCVATEQDVDQKALNDVWETLSVGMGDSARVLDLATGNGAVPYALLAHNDTYKISAVDKADIAPLRYLSDRGLLESVEFVPNTDINNLEFKPNTFDAITSQFGIEYAGLEVATIAILPLLKSSGKLRFLVHHADSEIVKRSQEKVNEMAELIKPAGLIECLLCVLRGESELSSLEKIAIDYQAVNTSLSQQISGQVFSGINQIVAQMQNNHRAALELGATLNLRIRSEHTRLSQMIDAAQSHKSIADFSDKLERDENVSIEFTPYYVDDKSSKYLLGWLVDGQNGG